MGNLEDYEAKLSEITAVKDDEIIHALHIPVSEFLKEADDLYAWCLPDKEKLVSAGLNWHVVKDIPVLTGAGREAEIRWTRLRNARKESTKELKQKMQDIRDLRRRLLHEFRFAFEKMPDILTTIRVINQTNSYPMMIQNLNDLLVLGRNNASPLEAINFDFSMLEKAGCLTTEGEENLSRITVRNKKEHQEVKKVRDQAITLLKTAVDEIRRYGQYVFWQDEERKSGYASAYLRKKKKNRKNALKNPDNMVSDDH